MEYLKRVLGIKVRYENETVDHLPNFIRTRYTLQRVYLDAQKAVFLYPKSELEQIVTLKNIWSVCKRVWIVRLFLC